MTLSLRGSILVLNNMAQHWHKKVRVNLKTSMKTVSNETVLKFEGSKTDTLPDIPQLRKDILYRLIRVKKFTHD